MKEINERKKWMNKKVKVFVKCLASHTVVYTGIIKDCDDNFILVNDRDGFNVWVNIGDVVQIREEDNLSDSPKVWNGDLR